MYKEKLKSLLLVFLVTTSVLLTQRVWFTSPLQMLSSGASYVYAREERLLMAREQVIRPEKIIVGFGGGTDNSHFTLLPPADLDRFWQEMKLILTNHFIGAPAVQAISMEKYETLRNNRNVEMHFAENFPTALLSVLLDQQENRLASTTNVIKSILVPARDQGSLYLIGDENRVYEFRLSTQQQVHLVDVARLVDSLPVNSYVKHYPLFSYVGNNTLLPLTYQHNKPRIFTESVIDASSNEQMNLWAGRFFNENFAFVKTIQKTDGTRIYMYGYGEQEVRINNRGHLEYTAKTGRQSSSNVGRALDNALLFMAEQYGTFDSLVLREVRLLEENQLRGYQFSFGYHLRGLPVVTAQLRHPVEIQVFGDQVRSFSVLRRRPMSLPEVTPEAGIMSPHRLIEKYFDELLEELAAQRGLPLSARVDPRDEGETPAQREEGQSTEMTEAPQATGEDLLAAIRAVELIYLDRQETHRRELLVPVWRIVIDQQVHDFDAHEGVRLQTSTLTEGNVR